MDVRRRRAQEVARRSRRGSAVACFAVRRRFNRRRARTARRARRSSAPPHSCWPDVTVGITDASMTRKPLDAAHAQLRIDDGERIRRIAHPARADAVEHRPARVRAQSRAAARRSSRRVRAASRRRTARETPAARRCRAACACRRRASCGRSLGRGSAARSAARRARIGRSDRAAVRATRGWHCHTAAVKPGYACSGSPGLSTDSGITLNCTSGRPSTRMLACTRRRRPGRRPPSAGPTAANSHSKPMPASCSGLRTSSLSDTRLLQADDRARLVVVLQVLADPGRIGDDRDAAAPRAGQPDRCRRAAAAAATGSRRRDRITSRVGARCVRRALAALPFDAGRARPVEQHARRQRVRQHRQVAAARAPGAGTHGRARAPAVLDAELIRADAVRRRAVEVGVARQPGLRRRRRPTPRNTDGRCAGSTRRARRSRRGTRSRRPRSARALEVRQHVDVAPARARRARAQSSKSSCWPRM